MTTPQFLREHRLLDSTSIVEVFFCVKALFSEIVVLDI